jgi:long-chain acyl-CoA synthetase
VAAIASGLAALGIGRGDTVGMMLVNRPEFHILDTAALHLGATPFSVYNTSTVEQLAYVCANAGNRVLITELRFLDLVLALRDRTDVLEHVIVIDGDSDPGTLTLAELEDRADPDFRFEKTWRSVGEDDIATLIYTSGTTGPPKGVMISHANLIAAWESSVVAVPVIARRGRYVSYLPSAHLADRVFSHYPAMINGSSITCVDDPRIAVAAMSDIRPTLWLAVPRIWEKLKAAIEAMLETAEDGVLHRMAIELGLEKVRTDQASAVEETRHASALFERDWQRADANFLAPLRSRLGLDAADLLVSGSAPIHPDVLEFFAALGLPICEGYGMTESTAVGTLNLPGEQRIGTVGRPLPGVELRLASDAEILLRGPGVMVGYRDDPDRTAEALDADGWLHTGDIGELDPDGYVRVVDRKKELIINAAGKNMSPANIEAQLKAASSLIAQAVAIGDRRPYNTALIVLDRDALAFHAHGHGLGAVSPEALTEDNTVLELIAAAVAEANTHLSRVEQVKRFTVLSDDWQPGGDELTPTLKLKRKAIAERYADVIDALYA